MPPHTHRPPPALATHATLGTETVHLLDHLQRLTAPNPGLMTGPGTNSYLVGSPGSGHIVIDPGPNHPEHIERLWSAAGGHISHIVCTHSHPDHAPAARPLQALCAQRGAAPPAILGLPSAPSARPDSHFTPDLVWSDGQRLRLGGPSGGHTLQAVHTPGHAANHLCLWLEEDGLLFSGDHILNGSTTVIDPPDGNMQDYLDALDRLHALCLAQGIAFILPAHGHVIDNASQAIARLKTHRLQREAKVAAALRAQPHGTPDDWVVSVYGDVPPHLWPVAMRSLMAHVERLRQLPHPHD